MHQDIKDLDKYLLSDRHGTYGGQAGLKEGLFINGEYWLIKYPKNTKGMRGPVASYTSSPLSEYIGSHIYKILGYDVHETILGYRNGKIVVACKDFCENLGDLREIRTLKNAYNDELEEKLSMSLSSTGSAHFISLEEILIHLQYNPIISKISGIEDRFWDLLIIDGLINNNDRNNGNWGLVKKGSELELAPIFDNGAAFSNKIPDEKIASIMANPEQMLDSALKTVVTFGDNNKQYQLKEIMNIGLLYPGFIKAIKRNVPLIEENMPKIEQFIMDIPEYYQGIAVCSKIRKEFYIKSMQLRFQHILKPTLEKIS